VFAFQESCKFTGQGGLHHGMRRELGLSEDTPLQFVDGKGRLKRHRVLRPQSAVVVVHGNAFRGGPAPLDSLRGSAKCSPVVQAASAIGMNLNYT
jgi:hypothetical protein